MCIFYGDFFFNKKETQFCTCELKTRFDRAYNLFYIFVKSYYIPKVIIKQNFIICVYSYALYFDVSMTIYGRYDYIQLLFKVNKFAFIKEVKKNSGLYHIVFEVAVHSFYRRETRFVFCIKKNKIIKQSQKVTCTSISTTTLKKCVGVILFKNTIYCDFYLTTQKVYFEEEKKMIVNR